MEPTIGMFIVFIEILMGTSTMAGVAVTGNRGRLRTADLERYKPAIIDFWTARYLIPIGALTLMLLVTILICCLQCRATGAKSRARESSPVKQEFEFASNLTKLDP